LIYVAQYKYDEMLNVVSAFLGTLLLISGISYYLQVIWHEENGTNEGKERAAFSLLDDL